MKSIGTTEGGRIVSMSNDEVSVLLQVYRAYNKINDQFEYTTLDDEFDVVLPLTLMRNAIRVVNTTKDLRGLVADLEEKIKGGGGKGI